MGDGRTREFKRLFITVSATVGIGSGAAAACVWRPDSLTALTLIPAWCWPLAGLVSTIPAWRIRSRRVAAALCILWMAFAVGWVEDFSSAARAVYATVFSRTIQNNSSLRVVSLNCDSNASCVSDMQRVKPDIVLLQEAPGSQALAEMTSQLFGDAGSFLSGGDTAILARGAIRQQFADRSAHFVAGTIVFDDGREIHAVSLRLAPPPSRLDFWSGGFWSDHRDLRNEHRRQLRQVMEQTSNVPSRRALVVGGDFNTTGLDRALDELRPRLTDAFAKHGLGCGATGTNAWPLFRVDQIWTDSRLGPMRVFAEKTNSSDHRMVICDAVVRD